MWLIGAMVYLLAASWVQLSVSAGNVWPHNALRHHWLMPIICHFRDYKALLVTSLTHVSGAIASVQTFTFTFTLYDVNDNGRILCASSYFYCRIQREALLYDAERAPLAIAEYLVRYITLFESCVCMCHRYRCEGRQWCVVGASNGQFGDPCPGTSKYLQLKYKCV